MAADSMAKATIHEPVGRKDLWHHKGWQLPAYIQHVANDLREKGRTESQAIRLAIGIVRNWSQGHNGNGKPVHPDTQAAAAKAMAEWEALKAAANRSKGHALATPAVTTEADIDRAISELTVDLAEGPHRYRHGWIRIDASAPSAIEQASRAVVTDGHTLLHGRGMVAAAHKVVERIKATGHGARVRRINVAGKPHLHVARTTR